MITKAKGEAIKEGSIPMSALSTEVKDKIENAGAGGGGADWNAQEGEVGYIKGRSHQINGAHGIPFEQWDKRFDEDGNAIYFHTLPTDNYSGCLIREGAWTNQEENYVFFGTEWKSLTPAVIADIRINYDSDSGDSVLEIKLYRESDSESFLATFINNALFAYGQGEIFIYKIANEFLPNTVLKTTPQTLSATDKNQALTNLGIDPVVWKYMCNPFIVKQGRKFPDELLVEGVNLDMKYHIPSMYRIFIEDETKVNSNASKGSTITPAYVGYTTMEGPTYSSSGEFVEASWYTDGSIDIHYSV